MSNPQAICVLGMHRSGTSCLTGMLEDAGVFLGQVSKQNPYNKKGNQENLDIMRLNDAVLAANGAAWDRPPEGEVSWSQEQRHALHAILSQYQGHAPWAFKDPRTLFTLSGWREALPELLCIGTFRHPGAVAQSLHRRGKLPPEQGFGLWLRYNQRLLRYHTEQRFDLLCFDLAPEAYMQAATRAFGRLGLDASHTSFAFFEEQLRNTAIEPMFAAPPAEAMHLYEQLRDLAA
ncbi:MAG TPA: sulfotransferase [Gammaproteobacteria bacterium]|jgi:hypothetical protein